MTRGRFALFIGLMLWPALVGAETSGRSHVVYDGQRLGSIAKRYGVSVDAICGANGMRPTDRLKPGQRLLIPNRGDRDGSRARAANSSSVRRRSATEPQESGPVTHRVESGQRLESIARRYGVRVDALRSENQLSSSSLIRPGQILRIPGSGHSDSEGRASGRSGSAYMRVPAKKGYLDLYNYNDRFKGTLFDKKGRLQQTAFTSVSRLLSATGERPRLDPRLMRILVDISDTFGGRPIRIVSGYRTTSYYEDSRHKQSRAIDFSIPGVPNEVIRDYLRGLPKVGVGYYPNSSFVHLDVREYAAYWVDYAGPGEAPRGKRQRGGSSHEHAEPGQVGRRQAGPSSHDHAEHDHTGREGAARAAFEHTHSEPRDSAPGGGLNERIKTGAPSSLGRLPDLDADPLKGFPTLTD